jgi:hypothetical protein
VITERERDEECVDNYYLYTEHDSQDGGLFTVTHATIHRNDAVALTLSRGDRQGISLLSVHINIYILSST